MFTSIIKKFAIAALTLMCLAAPASAGPALKSALGVTGRHCVINGNQGGLVKIYLQAVNEARAEHLNCKIVGPCMSACALFADKMRPHVCIEPSGELDFHNYKDERGVYSFPTQYSADITVWLRKWGTLPDESFVKLDAAMATYLRLLPPCHDWMASYK